MRKISVIGSRSFTDYELLKKTLDELEPFILVSGGAKKGADALAERYAIEKGYEMIIFRPDRKKYAGGAYFRRNEQIVKEAEKLIVFWNGGSKGTAHTLGLARKKGMPVTIINFINKEEKS